MSNDFISLVEKVEKIEKERAEKIARFLQLLRDPDLSAYVNILRGGGSDSADISDKSTNFIPPIGFKNGNGIRDAIRNLGLPKQFTADDVISALEAQSFQFASNDRKGTIRDALYMLTRNGGPFRKVKLGSGGQPNVYERNL